jgi:hypothetical protein
MGAFNSPPDEPEVYEADFLSNATRRDVRTRRRRQWRALCGCGMGRLVLRAIWATTAVSDVLRPPHLLRHLLPSTHSECDCKHIMLLRHLLSPADSIRVARLPNLLRRLLPEPDSKRDLPDMYGISSMPATP